MACLTTYSPEFTDLILSTDNLDYTVAGFAEGTFISIEPFEDRMTPVYGAKGESYRAVSAVKAFNLTVTLSQTSHSNDVLTLLLRNDRETLDGTFGLTLKDASGTTIFTERCAYIGQEPTQAFSGGGAIESREWTIHLPNPTDYMIGGNSRFSEDDQSAVQALGGEVDQQWTPQT
jgi:hypothetical protein